MEINQITYSYDQQVHHLNHINAKIELGKVTTIIGPNGSGKSTLLGIMANNYTPLKGQVILDGKDLKNFKSKELARNIAIVHQHNSAPKDMTVERLTSYGRLPYRSFLSSTLETDQEVVDWALEQTNLKAKRNKKISALSGGERQRVWIAMTLAQKTPYLFLDEPTTYLDIYHQYELLELIKRLNIEQNLTIVMVLHDINQAIKYSDKIFVMKDGKLAIQGTPKEVITKQTIKEIYGLDVSIREDEEAGLFTVPIGI